MQSKVAKLKSLPTPPSTVDVAQNPQLYPDLQEIPDTPQSQDDMSMNDNDNDSDNDIEIIKDIQNKKSKQIIIDSDDLSSDFIEFSPQRNKNRKLRDEDRQSRRSKSQTTSIRERESQGSTKSRRGRPPTKKNTNSKTSKRGRPKNKKKSKQDIIVPPFMDHPVHEMGQLSFEDRLTSMIMLTGVQHKNRRKWKQIKSALTQFLRHSMYI